MGRPLHTWRNCASLWSHFTAVRSCNIASHPSNSSFDADSDRLAPVLYVRPPCHNGSTILGRKTIYKECGSASDSATMSDTVRVSCTEFRASSQIA